MTTKTCTYAYWLTLNRRARKPAIRAHAIRRKPYLCERPAPWIGESETRDELIAKARNLLRGIRKYGPHADSVREIRGILSDVALIRAASAKRARVPSEGRAFYVSIRDGKRYGLLYGPLPTQADALRSLRSVESVAHDVNRSESAFASFGTCSLPTEDARPGCLNHLLPEIA
jgi:hypothetical protein